jgi:hypothetical protein
MSIRADIDRGLEIRLQIKTLEAELKKIEARLEAAGLLGPQVPLEEQDREGRQYIAAGSAHKVSVIFSADSIISSFQENSGTHIQLRSLLGDMLNVFFRRSWSNRFRDGQAFRAHAREMLGPRAPQLITACLARDKEGIPRNKIVVAWHEAKPLNATDVKRNEGRESAS